jgi:hypothetical protein
VARTATLDAEAAKSSNLDSMTVSQRFGHGIQHNLDGQFGVFATQLAELLSQLLYQVRSGHA